MRAWAWGPQANFWGPHDVSTTCLPTLARALGSAMLRTCPRPPAGAPASPRPANPSPSPRFRHAAHLERAHGLLQARLERLFLVRQAPLALLLLHGRRAHRDGASQHGLQGVCGLGHRTGSELGQHQHGPQGATGRGASSLPSRARRPPTQFSSPAPAAGGWCRTTGAPAPPPPPAPVARPPPAARAARPGRARRAATRPAPPPRRTA